jgi:hypothetical protein
MSNKSILSSMQYTLALPDTANAGNQVSLLTESILANNSSKTGERQDTKKSLSAFAMFPTLHTATSNRQLNKIKIDEGKTRN